MKKIWMMLGASLFFSQALLAQTPSKKPKLIIGIVVDQMRQDYLYKYADRYSEDGFKRLIREGYMMKNAHYNYIPTYTGPGHASVYTGTTPATHGIIANVGMIENSTALFTAQVILQFRQLAAAKVAGRSVREIF